ncbi:HD-GYP domain-containing protein [Paenibacillus pinistramenti]|uniref:HD-GYP domain-containing protein n=1 Tax=Paenibacillus pinistramenti TaxID=1768003 RepID=UPI001109BCD2|nr:HD domain-containing phosphohydrolase [Paenibacillus pinistramenti]
MEVYRKFVQRLILNYLIGSIIVVLGVGGVVIYSSLDVPGIELERLSLVLLFSVILMMAMDAMAFIKDMKPVKGLFEAEAEDRTWPEFQQAYLHIHRLPFLAVKRILGPHFLSLSIPAVLLTSWLVNIKAVTIPLHYLLLAGIGALLIALMHALIEFYLTSWACRPLIEEVLRVSESQYGRRISLEGQVIMSIRRKFQLSTFLIGVFPLLLYGTVVQVKLGGWETASNAYWQWAGVILVLGMAFSYGGAWILTREIERPIHHLYDMMAKVKAGDLDIQADDFYSDEFAKLVFGFNHMLEGIKVQNSRNEQLIESYFSTLAAALDARDPYTAGHSQRVAEYAMHIGMLAKLPDKMMEELRKSALLHDIGKIGTRDAVLLKDGVLTDEEFHQIKQHPVQGEMILQRVEPADAMAPILPGVRSHHERFDGKGYPDSLKGENIPLFGRIIAVADAFDAMTSDRPYRKGMDTDTAINILDKGRGTQWDPYFAGLFVNDYRQKRKAY